MKTLYESILDQDIDLDSNILIHDIYSIRYNKGNDIAINTATYTSVNKRFTNANPPCDKLFHIKSAFGVKMVDRWLIDWIASQPAILLNDYKELLKQFNAWWSTNKMTLSVIQRNGETVVGFHLASNRKLFLEVLLKKQ